LMNEEREVLSWQDLHYQEICIMEKVQLKI